MRISEYAHHDLLRDQPGLYDNIPRVKVGPFNFNDSNGDAIIGTGYTIL